MCHFKEGGDLEEYLDRLEEELETCQVGREEWADGNLMARLPDSCAGLLRDIKRDEVEYADIKHRLLTTLGYSSGKAAESWFQSKWEDLRKLGAPGVVHQGRLQVSRMVAPLRMERAMEAAQLKGWVYAMLPCKGETAHD